MDHFWDGTGGAIVGVCGSLGIAYLIFRLTRKSERARGAEQLAEQRRANEDLLKLTSDHTRDIAREQASLEAAESLTAAISSALRRTADATVDGDVARASRSRMEITLALSNRFLMKAPAIRSDDLREQVQEALVAINRYDDWHRNREQAWSASTSHLRPEVVRLPRGDQDKRAFEVLRDYLLCVMDTLAQYRMGSAPSERHKAPTEADFGIWEGFDT